MKKFPGGLVMPALGAAVKMSGMYATYLPCSFYMLMTVQFPLPTNMLSSELQSKMNCLQGISPGISHRHLTLFKASPFSLGPYYWKTMLHPDFKLDTGESSLALFSPPFSTVINHTSFQFYFSKFWDSAVIYIFPLLESRICPHLNYWNNWLTNAPAYIPTARYFF